jgi:hypothetical protein
MRKVPVLRRTRQHRITDDPVQTADINPQFRRLERFCGFEYWLVAYCLRRGAACVLAKETTGLTRRFSMGHSFDKEFEPYQSVVSSIDFPAMLRGVQQRSVACLTGISPSSSHSAHSSASLAFHPAETAALACVPHWYFLEQKQHRSSEHICSRNREGQTNWGQKRCSRRVRTRPPDC